MNIPLKKQHADWIAAQVDAGRYASEIEAIEDAVASMMRSDEDARAADRQDLREKLLLAEEDIRQGRVVVADGAYWESKLKRLRDRSQES